ncbi:glucose-1-phosphate cytidylyltransferase [Nitrosopumilus sp. S4]
MKAVILAGGFGSRLSEETVVKPKPLVEIGTKPILWHIMKTYSHYGINDFVICCGYKGYLVKEYFANYFLHTSDVTIDIENNCMDVHKKKGEPWKITLVDTGSNTMTGGRLKRVQEYVEDETFCFTYGDGVVDVNIENLIQFHNNQKKIATVTAVRPPGRFGSLELKDDCVNRFVEKPTGDGNWINGGFFVLEPTVFQYLKDDSTVWEKDPLEKLSSEGQLSAFKHMGFWHAMDTIRDKQLLEKMWNEGNPPWKVW